ncbi:PDR/VanB family oxidoreductase [Arthrobacter sp. MYb213]|uniref:PDR/VanB family oxidoreductase n=1 Tax=Arthrobacter sp. MYb213 TaxID=1848595 RepID=UPI000CFC9235|nr:PDR/VanB family oxidoreductase [Arthrobacter sp. MYb213]PRB70524.1 oxidoreductase [Arthrobacter sp. MYb213]
MPTNVASNQIDESAAAQPKSSRPGVRSLRVARKELLAEGVVRLRLEEPHGARVPDWGPGAHIELVLPVSEGESLSRHYSLCGDRGDANAYEVAVLNEPNSRGGSRYIHEVLAEGDIVTVGTPRNNFFLSQAERFEFIAGGIGITPIMTMIAAAEKLGIDWHLHYGGRNRDSMAFLKELEAYGDKITIWPQDEMGHLNLSFLETMPQGGRVYCCGPEPLLNAVKGAAANWPDWAVRFERFVAATLEAPVRTEPFELELEVSQKTVTVKPDETVLSALSDAGIPVLASCMEGVCGTCEVSVLRGTPEHRDSLLNDAERAKNDRMFVCVSRAVSDRLVLDL